MHSSRHVPKEHDVSGTYTPPKTNECPLERDQFNRKYESEPTMDFSGDSHVSFPIAGSQNSPLSLDDSTTKAACLL